MKFTQTIFSQALLTNHQGQHTVFRSGMTAHHSKFGYSCVSLKEHYQKIWLGDYVASSN